MLKTMETEWRDVAWDEALAGAHPQVREALERALGGEDLGFDEGLLLATVDDDDLIALVKVADEICRRVVGDCVSYVVNRNLNFTNVCTVDCAFCRFSRGPDLA